MAVFPQPAGEGVHHRRETASRSATAVRLAFAE
jgi:hypothetical protein